MKDSFPGYYRPTHSAFQKLWEDCLFAVDANVLLNIYGYSADTRNELIGLLESVATRLVIPYQFAMEYQRNRARAIMEQVKNYSRVEKILRDLFDQDLQPKHKHPYLSRDCLKAFKQIQKDLAKGKKRHEDLFSNDPYAERISNLFKTVGTKPSDIAPLCEEAKRRYAGKIPPGFADEKNKGEPERYGDCIGWLQLIDIAKAANKPVILVTDDSKEDWWQIENERTIGPHPLLVAEFKEKTSQAFYMYSANRFMELSTSYLKTSIPKGAIEEVQISWEERIRSNLDRLLKSGHSAVPFQTPSDAKSYVPADPKPTSAENTDLKAPDTSENKQLPPPAPEAEIPKKE